MNNSSTFKALMIISGLRGITSTVIRVFLPVYAFTIGMSMADIGFATTIAIAVSVLILPVMGYLTDVVGRKTTLLLSIILMALSAILLYICPTSMGVTIAYVLFYTSFFSWQPARGAMVVDTTSGTSIASAFAYLSLAFWIPRTITPYIAGTIIVHYGYSIVFLGSAIILILITIPIIILIKEARSPISENKSFKVIIEGMIPKRHELPLHVILSLDRIGWTLWLPIINPFMKSEYGLNEDDIGLLNTVMNIVTVIALIPSGKMVDKKGWKLGLILSEMAGILGLLVIIFTSTIYPLIIAMSLFGISIGLWLPSYNASIPSIIRNREELGRAYSRANIYRAILSTPSPWIGGVMYAILPLLPLISGSIILTINTLIITSYKLKVP